MAVGATMDAFDHVPLYADEEAPPRRRGRGKRRPGGNEHTEFHYEPTYVNEGQSVTSLSIPIIIAVVILVSMMGVTYTATNEFANLRHTIEKLADQMQGMAEGLGKRIDRVEDRIEKGTADRWTRKDHDYWCTRTEQVNADLGWKCAENPGQPRIEKRFNWRPEAKK